MTSKEKKILAISLAISVFVAGAVLAYFLAKKMLNKEKYALILNAKADLVAWAGHNELSKVVSSILVTYWKAAGVNFKESQMQSASTHSTYPWSAAYISSLVLRSGFKNFKGATTHAKYVLEAKDHRDEKLKPAYWAYAPIEGKKVEIGDILVKGRSGSNPTLQNLTASTQTHGDIVVDYQTVKGKKYAVTQGGNVSNTVKTTLVPLRDNLELALPYTHFAQLKYEK